MGAAPPPGPRAGRGHRRPPALLRLEPLSEQHLEAVADLLEDPAVHDYTMVPVPVPAGFERQWLERYDAGRQEGTHEAFAAVDDDGSFLGLALAFAIDREGRELELGYVVVPAARGRGVGSEALGLLTEWAVRELDPLRIELQISADNVGSKRVAAHAGYIYEGTRRSAHFKQGLRQDLEIWSKIAGELRPG